MADLSDRIAEVLHDKLDDRDVITVRDQTRTRIHPGWTGPIAWELAEAVVAAIQPQITTREELDALPHLSLVLRHYTSQAGWKLHEVWERRNESWYCIAAPLNPPGLEFGVPTLPVRLVWHPSWVGVLGEEQGETR